MRGLKYCSLVLLLVSLPAKADTKGMVWIPGGEFMMGSDKHYSEEAPAHKVKVSGFWIDEHEVTNDQFRAFVDSTNYVTVAERPVKKEDFPDADPALLKPGSSVFTPPKQVISADITQWWTYVPGASWKHPEGPASSIEGKGSFPVVHVAYEDAAAYAKWAGRDLPTEAQWEYAARAPGASEVDFDYKRERFNANTWQGKFPSYNSKEDGHFGLAPIKSFPPNKRGLYDMIGNVWEWTGDWFREGHEKVEDTNPKGPKTGCGNTQHTKDKEVRVIKGGSFLCAPNYCIRYRPAARHAQEVGTGTSHIGFRTVKNVN